MIGLEVGDRRLEGGDWRLEGVRLLRCGRSSLRDEDRHPKGEMARCRKMKNGKWRMEALEAG
jgi:hypothetical protein